MTNQVAAAERRRAWICSAQAVRRTNRMQAGRQGGREAGRQAGREAGTRQSAGKTNRSWVEAGRNTCGWEQIERSQVQQIKGMQVYRKVANRR